MQNLNRCKNEYGQNCFFCSHNQATVVHYVDGNRSNDAIENMRPCCPNCLKKIHSPNTKYIEWSKKLKNPPIEAPDTAQIKREIEKSEKPYVSVQKLSENLDIDTSILQNISDYSDDISVENVEDTDWVLFLNEYKDSTPSEFITLFPDRAEVVVGNADDETTNSLSKVAHLEDMNERSLMYKIEKEDVWNSPFDTFNEYIECLESTVDNITPRLEERLESYWNRADMFEL